MYTRSSLALLDSRYQGRCSPCTMNEQEWMCLGVDVHEGHGNPEQHGGAALEEEDVPHAQAGLQRQRVHEEAEEPLRGHARHARAQGLQVARQARETRFHQVPEHQLVDLHGC